MNAVNFGRDSTTEQVLRGANLVGKRILVTGVSAGLGIETARALVAHGAEVVGTARDLDKAQRATAHIASEARPGGSLTIERLDLASLASVRACADRLLADGRAFDVVIANAGTMATPFGHTEDGFETQFGTNHLGHFVLINRIASLIRDGGRVVSLSSMGHRFADVDLVDPGFEHAQYEPWAAYGRSKTANSLFAVEFDRRHRARGIRAAAVHPGGIHTELARHLDPAALAAMVEKVNADAVAAGHEPHRFKSIPQGAATSVWAAIVAAPDVVGGRYCEDCQVSTNITDGPLSMGVPGVRPYALDADHARALWALSETLVGEVFAEVVPA